MKKVEEAVLFRTSAASDVQCSGNVITVAGLKTSTDKKFLSWLKQIKYRAEVSQVVTVAGVDTAWTATGSTTYGVYLGNVRTNVAGAQNVLKPYNYTTPADVTTIGGTAQARREYIATQIVAKINADSTNYVTAAVTSNGTFTITDDAGYNPNLLSDWNILYTQGQSGRMGATTVGIWADSSGYGYATTNIATTTSAVYSVGIGADLLNGKPVMDFMYGNLISGTLIAPPVTAAGLPAVSGQKYDAFVLSSYNLASAHNQTGQYALVPKTQTVWVDNGTGSDTANLAGFKAIERVFHKLALGVYKNDAATTQEWFDRPIVFQDPLGAAPTGTADTLGWQLSPYGSLNRTNIGTQTIVAPVLDDTGLLIDQDDTATEGSHTSANQQVLSDCSFIVGKTAFSVVARVVAGDWTDTQFMVGFRKKAVYAADYNNYTDLAAIGGGAADGDSITTQGILNNAATVATDSGTNFADAASMLLMVKVALDGTVSAYFANSTGGWTSAPIYSVGTTTLIFDAGDEMIPFYQHVNIGSGNPAVSIGEFFAVSDNTLLS